MNYPKVLIIGETFRLTGGGGITLINLFKDWPSDRLAVITELIDESTPDSNCKKFYQLGHLEKKLPFPIYLFKKKRISGEVDINSNRTNHTIEYDNKKRIKSIIRDILNKIFRFLGIYYFIYKTNISDKLLDWIKEFSPDIIYVQPSLYYDMLFAYELQDRTQIPFAVHIMDDSISFMNKPNLLYLYWRKKMNAVFQQLINRAVICMSISKYMSDEYCNRYKKRFIPFRNPIELNKWIPYIKNNWDIGNTIHIIYTGRIAIPNINSLFRFCQVVNNLNNFGSNIKFDIYSIDKNLGFNRKVKDFLGVNINYPVPYEEIPKLIPKYDIALMPIDFNKKGITFAKYSISTKISEYLISGVPVLLLAPKEVALTNYAYENDCMLIVNEVKNEKITEALINLIHEKYLRESLAKKAINVAMKDSDAIKVRQEFKSLLNIKTN